MTLKEEIKSFLKGDVEDDNKTLERYSTDASIFQVKPQLVVFPRDAEDIKNLVAFLNKREEKGITLTPRSAGTDMTGGPLTESVVVELTRYFNKIKQVGEGFAITQPGVFYRDFEKETLKRGYLLPSYPASREICAVGGMVANNSAGEKSLTYGKTERYVEELKVILSDGNQYTLEPLTKTELAKKMEQNDFEGKLYRDIFQLVDQNYDTLEQAKPKVSKNSAGYKLWNVWDKETFNLAQLFVGSQGTLGFITEIKFRLIKPKTHSKMLVIFLNDVKLLGKIVNKVLQHKPESFESYDDNTLKLAIKYFWEFIKFFKTNIFSLAWQFLPEFWMGLVSGLPKLILIAEFTGDSEKEVTQSAQAAQNDLAEFNVPTRLTKTPAESQKYWLIRRQSFSLLRQHIKGKHTAPFIDDFVVQPEKLPEFLPQLNEILSKYNLVYTVAGHIGDGNFHIIPLMNLADPKAREIIFELSDKVYDLVLKFGGSITGEHNDGIIRSPYLKEMYGEQVYSLFEKAERLFDPNDIFNPGKKVRASIEYARAHIKQK